MIDEHHRKHRKHWLLCLFALFIAIMGLVLPEAIEQDVAFEIVKNNTDLCTFNHTSNLCDGSRQSNVTYYTNDTPIVLYVFAHASAAGGVAGVFLYRDDILIASQSGRPLAAPEQTWREVTAIIPKNSSYRVNFTNYHHFEWREDQILSGRNGTLSINNNYTNNTYTNNTYNNTYINQTNITQTGGNITITGLIPIVSSNYTQYSNMTTLSTMSYTWVKMQEITLNASYYGDFNTSFLLVCTDGGTCSTDDVEARAQIRKNDIAFGSVCTNPTAAYISCDERFTAQTLNRTDKIQIYAMVYDLLQFDDYFTHVKDFQIKFNQSGNMIYTNDGSNFSYAPIEATNTSINMFADLNMTDHNINMQGGLSIGINRGSVGFFQNYSSAYGQYGALVNLDSAYGSYIGITENAFYNTSQDKWYRANRSKGSILLLLMANNLTQTSGTENYGYQIYAVRENTSAVYDSANGGYRIEGSEFEAPMIMNQGSVTFGSNINVTISKLSGGAGIVYVDDNGLLKKVTGSTGTGNVYTCWNKSTKQPFYGTPGC